MTRPCHCICNALHIHVQIKTQCSSLQ